MRKSQEKCLFKVIIIIIRVIMKIMTIIMTIITIIIIIIKIIIIVSPRAGNIGFMSSGDSLISWGEESSLALVSNPSRDGVSMKILMWRHLKPNPQLE